MAENMNIRMGLNSVVMALAACCFGGSMMAQTPREDFGRDTTLSGSNYVAYRGPQKQLTPAPAGYRPFYLSHYGRHGSRYMIGREAYDMPYGCLLKADSAGALTPLGKDVLRRVALIREDARGRDGELTPLGALQHQGIARRMAERFPEVFEGEANVEARSTVVIRCILSMENALHQLLRMNPRLRIFHDASWHDMYYMNQGEFGDRYIDSMRYCKARQDAEEAFAQKHGNGRRIMRELFADQAWAEKNVDPSVLGRKLYEMASAIQGTELRGKVSLYDLFTLDELYDNWLVSNLWWYYSCGFSSLTGNVVPFSQRNLLRNIIQQADSCMALSHPGATLRYGHDTMVTPLVCLLDLNGYGADIQDPEKVATQWFDYRITPMATNVQFVFYRKNVDDKDVLFKVLLNEDEATLPLKTATPPYYHWTDFKAHFLKKLEAYEAQ